MPLVYDMMISYCHKKFCKSSSGSQMRTVGSAFGKLYSRPWDRQTVRIYLLGPDTTGTYLPFVVVDVVCCLVTILLQHRHCLVCRKPSYVTAAQK